MAFVDEYADHDATGLAELVRKREVTPAEIIDAAFATIDRLNPALNAVIGRMTEQAYAQAARVRPGASPIAGAPIVLKDEYQVYAGYPTNSASRLCQGFTLPYDTELVRRYKQAGVMVIGKSNLPELGASVATEPVLNGISRNPWNLDRGVGGSSGGSAAAVASGMVPLGYANDGAGSIRIPASVNGVFGLKPTRARVPCGPNASELWNGLVIEGAVTRTVRDAAAILDAIDGPDLGAPYHPPPKTRPYVDEVAQPVGRLRIAFTAKPPFETPVDPDCRRALEDAAGLCESLGHEVVEDAPAFDGAALADAIGRLLAIHLALGIDEMSAVMGRRASPENVERNHWQIYDWGKTLTATEMLGILNLFGTTARRVAPFFERYDAWLTPTLALTPRPHGWVAVNSSEYDREEYLRRFFAFVPFTPIANVTGQPAMSVPLYWSDDGLPVGVQFVARFGAEDLLFRLAAQLEQAQPWRGRRPPHGAWTTGR